MKIDSLYQSAILRVACKANFDIETLFVEATQVECGLKTSIFKSVLIMVWSGT